MGWNRFEGKILEVEGVSAYSPTLKASNSGSVYWGAGWGGRKEKLGKCWNRRMETYIGLDHKGLTRHWASHFHSSSALLGTREGSFTDWLSGKFRQWEAQVERWGWKQDRGQAVTLSLCAEWPPQHQLRGPCGQSPPPAPLNGLSSCLQLPPPPWLTSHHLIILCLVSSLLH